MKVLVTGAGGFVGRHLADELTGAGHSLVLTSDRPGTLTLADGQTYEVHQGDINSRAALGELFRHHEPDAVVHLAAISHVVNAQNEREKLCAVNVVGTHNVCAAASSLRKPLSFLYVSSSLVYGSQSMGDVAFDEASLPAPETAYGASKLAGEYVVRSFKSDLFKPFIVRPFNHIGPGQSRQFVCPTLAKKIADAASPGVIAVGNLQTYRDFSDVRDVVRAYRLILEKKPHDDLFVIGSGEPMQIEEVLKRLIQISGKSISTSTDKALLREVDPHKLYADTTRARTVLGWQAQVPLTTTLEAIYREAAESTMLR